MLAIGQQQSNICELVLVSLFQRKIILDYDKSVCFLLGGFPVSDFFQCFRQWKPGITKAPVVELTMGSILRLPGKPSSVAFKQ